MKFKRIILLSIAFISMGIGLQLNQPTAKAATHHTPSSWQGTYYTTSDDVMDVNEHSVVLNGKTMYKNTWSGWRRLTFSKVKVLHHHSVYQFNKAKYGYQSSHMWRLTSKKGKKELINYANMGAVVVWHKYYSPKKVKFRTANNTDFFYNYWEPAYLDVYSDGVDLYDSYDDAKNQDNSVGSFTNLTQQVSAKWISKNQQDDILMLKINGKTYYANNHSHDIRPYSAYRDKDGIWSSFKPTSKYARLKKGNHVYVGTEWSVVSDKDVKTYKYNGSHWKYAF